MRKMLILLVLCSCTASAEIYRWVDGQGNVQFGDFPPEGARTEELHPEVQTTIPAFTPPAGPEPVAEPSAGTGAPRQRIDAVAPDCFDPAAALLGRSRADPNRSLNPRTLTPAERDDLEQWFREAEGNWTGPALTLICGGSVENPRRDQEPYRMSLRVERDTDGRWWFSAEQDALGEAMNKERRFWFSLGEEALGFGTADTSEPDAERWRVDVLTATPTDLVFARKFRHRTGAGAVLAKVELRVLHITRHELTFGEYIYTQGALSDLEEWTLER